ncbi:HIT family protein [Candidatus Woesearchaeota archaeon]|nr:HIT family protein [Candidatus Woesearchaeota archaeon]
MASDCVFCRIIEGTLPSSQVYEDDDTLVFLDIAPVNKGHCLVIPKEHYEDAQDTPPETLANLVKVAQKVGDALVKGVHAEGFNIGINTKKAAGQVVFHIHIHVIPRFSHDGLKLWPGKKYEEGETETIKDAITSCDSLLNT